MNNIKKVSLMLSILGFSSSVIANNTEEMSCPAPESVKYVSSRYEAKETHKGWEGRWVSRPHKQGEIEKFSIAEYFSENDKRTEGTLTNCTYKLREGSDVVDLEYHKNGEESGLKTLIVSIKKQPYWRKESGAIGIQGYECIKSATECKFIPLQIKEN
ncbi:DUF3757 domain-containing protein [Erwinia tracheiphila]|uniref:DUF3757 domain-containing protein n=1 Tax=Erwinia tracheiphila TaxID=65700 RepID=A0A0M2K9E8_9GAMM|nr:DUF3757 domain-containing protein [Erwinia tracheiphila]EOS93716.1 hypothetical protein ETR_17609 [Erwinia tracheiphila PSU-1]KKF35554.1 hypothetical protein SY86_09120 [Erwinia tracheiphila]UIA89721.1 DUF3757 domain-containing protein [Erwinia tracheiphila]UIA98023.1 DUF3757 domain-containing protein [Erwinia tracheiphila]